MTYKHYKLTRTKAGDVEVFDPRWPDKPLFRTGTFDQAKCFVRAYRDGAAWADQAVLA